MIGGAPGFGGGAYSASQLDHSQTISGSGGPTYGSVQYNSVNNQIDLLELCNNINEDTFKQETKKAKKQQPSQTTAGGKETQKKKLQGTGQFNMTKTEVKP